MDFLLKEKKKVLSAPSVSLRPFPHGNCFEKETQEEWDEINEQLRNRLIFKKKKHSTFPANPVPVFVLFFPLQSIDRVDFLKLGDPTGRRWGKIKEIKESFVSSFLLSFIHSVLFRHRFVVALTSANPQLMTLKTRRRCNDTIHVWRRILIRFFFKQFFFRVFQTDENVVDLGDGQIVEEI